MSSFENVEKICRVQNPNQWTEEKNTWMVAACREMAQFHYENNADVRHVYDRATFDPATVKEEKDIERIPAISVVAMKYFLIATRPESELVLKLTSSGTGGQKTQIWFDKESLDRCQAMLGSQWEEEHFVSSKPNNYLMFVYDPKEAKDLGVAFSDKNQQQFAPVNRSYYAVQKNKETDKWEFRMAEVLQTLREYAAEEKPVRLFGIPAFVFELLEELKRQNLRFSLHPESLMMTGGGWKAAEDKKITRNEFRRVVKDYLGVSDHRIRDGYGMAEHCAPYVDCPSHRFHVPVYNRILVRDPITMKVLPDGETGLLELITPFNSMMPNLAILSTDLGYIDAEKCPCGARTPTFTLLGRGGLLKHKGCAISANDIVKRRVA